jgi:hypothetical protein
MDHVFRFSINPSLRLEFGRRAPPQWMLTGATLVTIRRERYHYFVQRGVLH